jgi:hypothetical protein
MTQVEPFTFGDPAGPGDVFNARDFMGELVAFVEPMRENASTRFGEGETTRCRYVIALSGDQAGEVFDNAYVWGNLGENAYAKGEHNIVLGRINQSEAKPGQNPAYILDPSTEEDQGIARQWFEAYARRNAAGHITIVAE